ncbi:UDP-N-acetylglucosamine 2-epimerase [candidate division WOR-1 bacterium RIFOXYA12_FULL_43_27]|uniref:UDP-N-acetylglucosamine 2-epimerase (non-hydrolyzing) n=1 Tax=candidate division WOR-1 bacterium RIFOXYC2_FULL_46_14 TaxID=1802587 RepID=A0A1F4U7U6_UNCSA|nr:MAG: UDP-N-acetylglucosamine 2-epimerase [candidate division WOR-1 bacterium RIFOXYA12_FULL_43_27]OGC19426.1 MAG: UDP-N-acetylglucosamine 2-epimerase [candidate division WOR-1 bacterium RIFOXYB2_FULL_46_45]OGC30415.1 MAG: UDP-N-acetylglucosamine 2-epimerase [candidate division WOR-1 bacterium RIFOXYA2_FULL_46_56]OGC41015.1 MAG: UDP-N-acetylglucosamine 2-epimerase [candidate division WOR-1 bacterium RIFOXYC2_FULL_46_14]
MKKIMVVFGTRPEAVKMAPVVLELKKYPHEFKTIVVSTGQHREMLKQILKLFKIRPAYDLGIMRKNQSISDIIANSIRGLEKIFIKEKPEMVLVQGDTSTAFAAGLAAFLHKIAVGHVEAGLRTGNKYNPFPEEVNRRLLSSVADLHFAPTKTSAKNLIKENIDPKTIHVTGNTVIDALHLALREKPFDNEGDDSNRRLQKMILVTVHRRESFGAPLKEICAAIKTIAKEYGDKIKIILPVHRNPNVLHTANKILGKIKNVKLTEPLDYHPFVHLMKQAYLILTDSGGVQEEAPGLGKPVLVLRRTTERPEAVLAGTVKLVGDKKEVIIRETKKLLDNKVAYVKMARAVNPYGDGKASPRIIKAIRSYFKL